MIFSQLSEVLGAAGEEVRFIVRAEAGGRLAVLVEPVLKGAGADIQDDAASRLRAALAFPLRIVATPAELDAGFLDTLANYAQTRAPAGDALAALMAQATDAIKEGRQAALAQKSNPQKTQPASGAAGEDDNKEEPPVEPVPQANPDSLF